MDPIRHAAISLAFLAATIKDMIVRALDSRRAGDLARSPSSERGESSAQDSERASGERRPIDF
jgi:hypothetical protein